jgi:hypothetical protein
MSELKLCSNCKHYDKLVADNGTFYRACLLKSSPSRVDFLTGKGVYYREDIRDIQDERKDSTGIFGLFKDKDRCGYDAKNFEPKEVESEEVLPTPPKEE